MSLCKNCGHRLDEGSRFCGNCGSAVLTKNMTYAKHTKKKSSKILMVLLWVFFLPVMAIISICKSRRLSKVLKVVLSTAIALVSIPLLAAACSDQPADDVSALVDSPDAIENTLDKSFLVPTEEKAVTPTMVPSSSPTQEPYFTITATPAITSLPLIDTTPTPTIVPTPVPTVSPTQAPTPTPETVIKAVTGYVNAGSLNMRSEPNRSSDIVKEYSRNQVVEIIGEDGDWYKVMVAGKTGYMIKEYVSTGTPLTEAVTRSTPQTNDSSDTVSKSSDRTVYVTETGKRYHYDGNCGNGTYYESTLERALGRGLTPCQKCVE